jgi:hypothetical protein
MEGPRAVAVARLDLAPDHLRDDLPRLLPL